MMVSEPSLPYGPPLRGDADSEGGLRGMMGWCSSHHLPLMVRLVINPVGTQAISLEALPFSRGVRAEMLILQGHNRF